MPLTAAGQVLAQVEALLRTLEPWASTVMRSTALGNDLSAVTLPAVLLFGAEENPSDTSTHNEGVQMEFVVEAVVAPAYPEEIDAAIDDATGRIKALFAQNDTLGNRVAWVRWRGTGAMIQPLEDIDTTVTSRRLTFSVAFAHPSKDPYTLLKG